MNSEFMDPQKLGSVNFFYVFTNYCPRENFNVYGLYTHTCKHYEKFIYTCILHEPLCFCL